MMFYGINWYQGAYIWLVYWNNYVLLAGPLGQHRRAYNWTYVDLDDQNKALETTQQENPLLTKLEQTSSRNLMAVLKYPGIILFQKPKQFFC